MTLSVSAGAPDKSLSIRTACLSLAASWLLLCATSVQAQAPDADSLREDHGWFYVGVGQSLPLFVSGVASVNLSTSPAVQLAINANEEFTLGNRATSVNAVSVSLGRTRADRWSRRAAFIGPAFVWGWSRIDRTRPDRSDRNRYYTGGLTGNVQLFFTPVMEFGIGIDVYGNLNPQMSVAGVRLVLLIEGYK